MNDIERRSLDRQSKNIRWFTLPPSRVKKVTASPAASTLIHASSTSLLSLSLVVISVLIAMTPVTSVSIFRPSYDVLEPSIVLKFGVILPYSTHYEFSMKKVLPAIQIAVERILQDPHLLRDIGEVVINEADSNCSQTEGPLEAIDMYLRGDAHVFFGPTCDLAVGHVALYSVSWNIPVISTGAFNQELDNKNEFRVLTRMQSTYSDVGNVFESIMDRFRWTTVGFIYDNHLCYHVTFPVFTKVVNRSNATVFQKPIYKHSTVIYESFLRDAQKQARM
ncbi:unnamed protein product [Candidula unifasciata]|uniref:Receptor ligand binding region domain-containing protein n=1 Tax=Candidula unifasciata TaxID=100452 RepID=A0A8S3ZMC2_9EUPU|nr:unnamed protein product [Candidula unifasciata]